MTRGGRAIVVFARAPELGRVKTRLAATVGARAALEIYRHLGWHTVDVAIEVPDAHVCVRYTPPRHRALMAAWLGSGVTMRAQAAGDLGQRMRAAVADALADGARSVVVVGTDCPGLDSAMIESAFRLLEPERGGEGEGAAADVVLGPAVDGGYYLLGVRSPHAALFRGIPWSTEHTLAATVRAAGATGLRVRLLDGRADIDTFDDWMAWLRSLDPEKTVRARNRTRECERFGGHAEHTT